MTDVTGGRYWHIGQAHFSRQGLELGAVVMMACDDDVTSDQNHIKAVVD